MNDEDLNELVYGCQPPPVPKEHADERIALLKNQLEVLMSSDVNTQKNNHAINLNLKFQKFWSRMSENKGDI